MPRSSVAQDSGENSREGILMEYVDRVKKEFDCTLAGDEALEILQAANFDIQEALIIMCKRAFAKMPPGTAYAENIAFAMGGKEGLNAFCRGQPSSIFPPLPGPTSTTNADEQDLPEDPTITYWIKVKMGDQEIHIPIKPEHVTGPEKEMVTSGIEGIRKWAQDNEPKEDRRRT